MINWFRKKLDSDKYETVVSDVPMSTIFRWYLYDTALSDNVNELAELIGLNPVSDEGDSKEKEDSKQRIAEMSPLMPFLDAMSELSASLISNMHMKEIEERLDEDEKEEFIKDLEGMFSIYKAVALSTLIGTMSVGLSLGIISSDTINSAFLTLGEQNHE